MDSHVILRYNYMYISKNNLYFTGGIHMWAYESTFYQIYPLGFCGAPFENDGNLEHRILKVLAYVPKEIEGKL